MRRAERGARDAWSRAEPEAMAPCACSECERAERSEVARALGTVVESGVPVAAQGCLPLPVCSLPPAA